ncbi:MAG TPA: YtxH domain-containing protein [Candidatus Binatia bacterium]|nr:YtxH domain-containing protein [Candidatus Binatia bacterium]
MPTRPARTADEITDTIRSAIDQITQEVTRRGQDVAELLADRGADVGSIVNDAWKDSRPLRRDAGGQLSDVTKDAAKWSDRTWRKAVRPALKDLWKQRTVALGAAGAAVPAGRELVDTAAERLGIKQREERHWGAFFLGLLLGAAAGAIVAMLTTPKPGSEVRRELGEKADELATKAKEEWVPIFQHDETTNGSGAAEAQLPGKSLTGSTMSLQEGAADAGSATGEAADQAAEDTAEAINESYDTVDRESPA